MSRATAEQHLLTLLPTLTTAPPPQLVDLALSLLAQSRHRASAALKPEEDAARAFACAHLACERLKTQLDLPPIEGVHRAPAPPRVYARLVEYLGRILPQTGPVSPSVKGGSASATPIRTASGRVRTPSSKLREALEAVSSVPRASSQPSRSRVVSSRGLDDDGDGEELRTPSKSTGRAIVASLAEKTTPTSTPKRVTFGPKPTPTRSKPDVHDDTLLAAWVVPTIRHVCRTLSRPTLVPTVLAGVETIVKTCYSSKSARKSGRSSNATSDADNDDAAWARSHLPALVAAVYLVVAAEIYMQTTGRRLDARAYEGERDRLLAVMGTARQKAALQPRGRGSGLDREDAWEGWREVDAKEVGDVTAHVIKRGWLASDWYRAIRDLAAREREREAEAEAEEEQEVDAAGVVYRRNGGRREQRKRAREREREAEIDEVRDGDEQMDVDEQLRMEEEEHVGRDLTGQVRRGDSMFQPKFDFLSEDRRREYRVWKVNILRRIEQLETGRSDPMDVSG